MCLKTEKWKPNGCGSKAPGISAITYHIIPDWCFESACDCHDYAYFYGGCKLVDQSSRYKADVEFFNQMIETIHNKVFFRRPFLKSMAWLYFKAVRAYGEKSFNWFATEGEWKNHVEEYYDEEKFI